MKKVIIFLLCASVTQIFAQVPLYFNTYFGTENDDIAYGIVQSKAGGYLVTGSSHGNSVSLADILLFRTNDIGIPVWNKVLGGSGNDLAKGIIELPDSSIVIVGSTTSFGAVGYDLLIIRTDKNGNEIWRKIVGGADWDFGRSVIRCNDGNLVVCGETYSYGRGGKDAYLLKLDPAGNIIWSKTFGGKNDDDFNQVIQNSAGNLITVGTTMSYGDSLGDIWYFEISLNGDSIWAKTNGGAKLDKGNSVIEYPAGNFVFAGGSESFSAGQMDAYLFKTDGAGIQQWNRNYGLATADEECFKILNSASSYGWMLILYTTKEKSLNGKDVKNMLLDGVGYWARGGSFGYLKDEEGFNMVSTSDKGYVACGYTNSFGLGDKDFFIVKYDSEMTIGPLHVDIQEAVDLFEKGLTLYPSYSIDKQINIKSSEPWNASSCRIQVTDYMGIEVPVLKVENENHLLKIIFPPTFSGVALVKVNGGQTFKCIIE